MGDSLRGSYRALEQYRTMKLCYGLVAGPELKEKIHGILREYLTPEDNIFRSFDYQRWLYETGRGPWVSLERKTCGTPTGSICCSATRGY